MGWRVGVWVALCLLSAGVLTMTWACNEVVCASIVSKCMLTNACKCDLSNCSSNASCCRDCSKCLAHLYHICCTCLGMCEPSTQVLDKTDSQVGDLNEPFTQLFQALTGEKDPLLRWTSMTFPIDVALSEIDTSTLDKNTYRLVAHPQDTTPHTEQVTVNCTVMYVSQCMSASKCKAYCVSTGAAAYRWFFDGCCECVGSTCVNYGVNESRCIQCPMEDDAQYDEELTDQYLAADDPDTFDDVAAQQADVIAQDEDQTL